MPVNDRMIFAAAENTGVSPEEAFNFFRRLPTYAGSSKGGEVEDTEDAVILLKSYKKAKDDVGGDPDLAMQKVFSIDTTESGTWAGRGKNPNSKTIMAEAPASSQEPKTAAQEADMEDTKTLPVAFKSPVLQRLYENVDTAATNVQIAADKQTAFLIQSQKDFMEQNANLVNKIMTVGGKSASVAYAEAAVLAKHGSESAQAANLLGMNADDITNVGGRLLVQIKDDTEYILGLRRSLVEKQNQIPDITDNPLGFIVGHMLMKGDIDRHNAFMGQLNQEKELFRGLKLAQDDFEATNKGKLDTLLAEKYKAIAEQNLAQASMDAEKAKIDGTRVSQALASIEIQRAKEKEAAARDKLTLYKDMINSEDMHTKRLAEELTKQEQKNLEEAELAQRNFALGKIGHPPVLSMKEYNRLPPALKASLIPLINSGGTVIADNIVDATGVVASAGDMSNASLPVKTLFAFAVHDIRMSKSELFDTDPLFKDHKPAEQKLEISQKVRKNFEKYQADVRLRPMAGVDSNPYDAPNVNTMLQKPEVANTRLGNLLVKAIASEPSAVLNPEKIVSTAKAAINSDYNGRWELLVADLNTYFRVAAAENNKAYNFEGWGLPDQRGFKFAGVDWTNPTEVMRRIAKVPFGKGVFNLGEFATAMGGGQSTDINPMPQGQ